MIFLPIPHSMLCEPAYNITLPNRAAFVVIHTRFSLYITLNALGAKKRFLSLLLILPSYVKANAAAPTVENRRAYFWLTDNSIILYADIYIMSSAVWNFTINFFSRQTRSFDPLKIRLKGRLPLLFQIRKPPPAKRKALANGRPSF